MSNLLGVLFAVLIATMAIPKIVTWQSFEIDNKVMAITAQEQKTFDTAVSGYVQANAIAIQAAATATIPATITVGMLQTTNFLPTSFSSKNPYDQTWEAQVLEPVAGNLQVLAISKGGRTLSDTQVNRISMSVPNGGFIPQNDGGAYPTATANAIGARASWNVATAGYVNIRGGHLAALFNFNQGQLSNNYLYRNAVPGQPQLNKMNTPLVMAAVETLGLACTPLGAIARDNIGSLLSCPASGLWQSVGGGSWKAPVSSFAALPAVNNTIGDVRLTTDFNRAYAWNGASWAALGVDQNGNMNVPGTLTVNNVQINGTASVGAACSPNGKIAQDGTGVLLSCQSGVWASNTACSPFYGDLNAYEGNPGTSTCLNGTMTNAPSGDWYFVDVKRHINPGNFYEVQTAHAMTGANIGIIFERVQVSATAGAGWGAWVKQGGADSGTICGMAARWFPLPYGPWQISTMLCKGYNPAAGSCPPGYTWINSGYGATYWGAAYCVKN